MGRKRTYQLSVEIRFDASCPPSLGSRSFIPLFGVPLAGIRSDRQRRGERERVKTFPTTVYEFEGRRSGESNLITA